jgi:hypothetical protein
MVLRRDQQITAATTLPAIDTAQGTAMVPVAITVTGLGSDTLGTEYDLFTGNDNAAFTGTTTTVQTAPASLLVASDGVSITATATSTNGGQRSATTSFSGTETTFALPPALTGITYSVTGGVLDASFGTLPPYDTIEMFATASSGSQHVIASKSWVAATGATKLAFDQIPPGYDPTWKVDLTKSYDRSFFTVGSSGTFGFVSQIDEAVNATARRVDPLLRRQQRALATSATRR